MAFVRNEAISLNRTRAGPAHFVWPRASGRSLMPEASLLTNPFRVAIQVTNRQSKEN